jgi:hypothetical protein
MKKAQFQERRESPDPCLIVTQMRIHGNNTEAENVSFLSSDQCSENHFCHEWLQMKTRHILCMYIQLTTAAASAAAARVAKNRLQEAAAANSANEKGCNHKATVSQISEGIN